MRHVGLWGGPGILLLLDGVWRYYDPAELESADGRALRETATACIGNDRPLITVQRAPDLPRDVVAP
jgi:hypothetical protein